MSILVKSVYPFFTLPAFSIVALSKTFKTKTALLSPNKNIKMHVDTIIFDLGAVLIDWNPRYLYRKIFSTEKEIDWFLENICTSEWNDKQDAGRSFEEAT